MTGIPRLYGRQERRRRPRPLLLGTVAVVALAAIIAWTRYDPVVGGSTGWCPDGSVLVADDGAAAATSEASATVCTVASTDHESVAFATTVRNDGLLPVWVRSTRLRGEIEGVLRVDGVRMAARNDVRDPTSRELVPFRAFRLGPGEERLVEVTGTLIPCEETASARAATFRFLPLRTTLLWLPRDSQAPFDPPVRLIAEPC